MRAPSLGRIMLGVSLALVASGSGSAQEVPPVPFYADKMNLLVYLDDEGEHPVTTLDEWAVRRSHILANMQLVMGPLPGPERKVPLDVQVVEEEQLDGLTRKKITYASESGHRVPAYLLIPDDLAGPAPAALCLHGSGGARGRTAGLGEDYPRYALELAQRGYVTIAPDYPLFGDNKVDLAALGYVSGTMKGVWDHMRAVDVLLSLPEVDAERIACIGVSLGGHNSLFVSAFDERIAAIVTSVGFDSFADYMGGNLSGWCQGCYMPRIATEYDKDPARLPFDFPEVLGVLAPRPLYIHAPLGDSNFKVESVRRCIEAAAPVYRLFDAEESLIAVHPEGGHGFPPEAREEAYRFLDSVLAHSR
jgi:dienelactone hydrolase